MNVNELRRLAEKESKEKITVYNPLIKRFSVNYEGITYTIEGKEIKAFPTHIARHLRKHLVDHIINEKELDPLTDRESVEKQTEVNL